MIQDWRRSVERGTKKPTSPNQAVVSAPVTSRRWVEKRR
jgi:hypothetical protein